jgi:hypothetical protein
MNTQVHHAAEALVALGIAARQFLVARRVVLQTAMRDHGRLILEQFVAVRTLDSVDRAALIALRLVAEMRQTRAHRHRAERRCDFWVEGGENGLLGVIDDDAHVGGTCEHGFDGGVAVGRTTHGQRILHLSPIVAARAVQVQTRRVVAPLFGHVADERRPSVFLCVRFPHLKRHRPLEPGDVSGEQKPT